MSKFSKYASMLGSIKSKKKSKASRKNGLLGGRPKTAKDRGKILVKSEKGS